MTRKINCNRMEVGNDPTENLPERTLWLAVISRAMRDYCFFFDRLSSEDYSPPYTAKGSRKSYTTLYHKAIAEFSRLRFWFNNPNPHPFNLVYIGHMLYEDGDGFAECIRKQAHAFLAAHLEEVEKENKYPELLKHFRQFIASDILPEDGQAKKFHYKRFRYYVN